MGEFQLKPGLNIVPTSEGLMEIQSIISKQESEEPRKKRPKKRVLIIPGAFYSAELVKDLQRELLKSLEQKFENYDIEVHALSLPGHGKSELKGRLHWKPFNANVKVLEEIMEKLGEETILVGHSIGGMVIQKYLEKHLAPAAILLAPANHSPHFMIDVAKHFLKYHKRTILSFLLNFSPKEAMKRPVTVKKIFYSEEIDTPEYNNFIKNFIEKMSDESIRGLLGAFMGKINYRKVSQTPIYIFGGEKDVAVQQRALKWLKKRLGAKLTIIFNATHSDLVNDELQGVKPMQGQVRWVAEHIAEYLLKSMKF
ncbi:MAG: alpha/beta hydrolase [Promethearchaeota archaeon]